MARQRKTRSDSTQGLIESARIREVSTANVPIGFALTDEELTIFQHHWHTREQWTPSEASMLCHLSQAESTIHRQRREIAEEGDIVLLSNGMECANPRFKILAQSERLMTQLISKLGLSAETRDAANRNSVSKGSSMARPSTTPIGDKPDWVALAKEGKK